MSKPNVRRRLTAACFFLVAWASHAQAAPDCAAFSAPVYQRVNPTSQTNLLTRSRNEADGAAANHGFTDDRGTPFKASASAATDLVAVHRLYKASTHDFVWISRAAEIASAVANYGYVDQGANFYASQAPAVCLQPVYRYLKGAIHRHAVQQPDRDALVAAGWRAEGVSFYAAVAAPAETRFAFAVIPDTQNEVLGNSNRYRGRAQWLADNKTSLNLKFVAHSGDIVNWGERDEPQYQRASSGLAPLDAAGIPFSLTPGNHDTRAVCAGGSACPGESAAVNVRLTPLFDQYFANRFANLAGRYEAGKLANHFSTYEAGGLQWLVLSLELWPRQAVIDWAKGVVSSHPQHNVIVVTHAYLNGDGSISTSNGGYGSTSPRYLFDNLVKVYPNVRMVFSGHVGLAASREDTGVNGNKIVSFLQCFHSTSNPVRIVEVDTAANSLDTLVYAPQTDTDYPEYDRTVDGLDFVR